MFLPACGSDQVKLQYVIPPAELMADCPERVVPLRTNGDIVLYAQSLKGDLASCNADKAALRTWAKEYSK